MRPRSHCPSVRHADRGPRQHPGGLVAAAARQVPALRHADLGAYPLVELLTGVLFAAVGARFAHSWALPAYPGAHRRARSRSRRSTSSTSSSRTASCTRSGIASVVLLAFAALLENDWSTFGRALLGAAAAFAFFFVLHLVVAGRHGLRRRAPVVRARSVPRLAGLARTCSAASSRASSTARSSGIVLIAVGRRGRRQHIPFGPFLAAGHDDLRALRRPARRLVARPRPIGLPYRTGRFARQRRSPDSRVSRYSLMRRFDDCCSCTSSGPRGDAWTTTIASSRSAKSPTPCGCRR